MKLLIHSQTSTIVPLKFGNGYVFFYSTLYNDCNYLSVLGLKLIHVCKRSSCTIHRKHNKRWFRCTTCLNDGTWLVGPCFNIKTVFPAIDFYCKDKPIVRQSYLYNGNPYTGKTTPLYWAACWARRIPKFNGLAKVKLSVGQVDLGTHFFNLYNLFGKMYRDVKFLDTSSPVQIIS